MLLLIYSMDFLSLFVFLTFGLFTNLSNSLTFGHFTNSLLDIWIFLQPIRDGITLGNPDFIARSKNKKDSCNTRGKKFSPYIAKQPHSFFYMVFVYFFFFFF